MAWRLTSGLRCLAHEGPPADPASLGRHDRDTVWPRWRASGDRGESSAQAATDRRAPSSPAGATPDSSDRLLFGFGSLFLSPGRIRKVAIGVRPSTLLAFHQALVRRKYRRLCSSSECLKQPGPKGPSEALIQAIVELTSRNPRPRFGGPRIARIIARTFGANIDKNVVYRVLSTHSRPTPGGTGSSWLSFIGHTTDSLWSVDLFRCESIVLRSYWVLVVMDQFTRRLVGVGVHRGPVNGADLCRMFNAAIHGQGPPRWYCQVEADGRF